MMKNSEKTFEEGENVQGHYVQTRDLIYNETDHVVMVLNMWFH